MDGPRVEWKSYLCHQTLPVLLTKNHTTIRKVPLGQGKNRGWLWHEKSIICKVWPRGLSSCSLGRDALAGSTVHNRVNVNHYRTCAIISCRLCGFSPYVKWVVVLLFFARPLLCSYSITVFNKPWQRKKKVLTWKELALAFLKKLQFKELKIFCQRL